jgi:hypothetical protein
MQRNGQLRSGGQIDFAAARYVLSNHASEHASQDIAAAWHSKFNAALIRNPCDIACGYDRAVALQHHGYAKPHGQGNRSISATCSFLAWHRNAHRSSQHRELTKVRRHNDKPLRRHAEIDRCQAMNRICI